VRNYLEHPNKPIVILYSLKNLEETLPNDFFEKNSSLLYRSNIAYKGHRVQKSHDWRYNIRLSISNSYYQELYESLVTGHIVKSISIH